MNRKERRRSGRVKGRDYNRRKEELISKGAENWVLFLAGERFPSQRNYDHGEAPRLVA